MIVKCQFFTWIALQCGDDLCFLLTFVRKANAAEEGTRRAM
jgi:hypothetical protein